MPPSLKTLLLLHKHWDKSKYITRTGFISLCRTVLPCLFGGGVLGQHNYTTTKWQTHHCCDMSAGKVSTLPPAFIKVNKQSSPVWRILSLELSKKKKQSVWKLAMGSHKTQEKNFKLKVFCSWITQGIIFTQLHWAHHRACKRIRLVWLCPWAFSSPGQNGSHNGIIRLELSP